MHTITPEKPTGCDSISSWSWCKFGFYAAWTMLFSLGVGLGVIEWFMYMQDQHISQSEHMDPGLLKFDPELGWRLAPDWSGSHHHYDYDAVYHVNEAGFRADSPVATLPGDASKRRVAVLGDSFTFGLGVADSETFVNLLNTINEAGTSFVNLGVPGYSTDQEYLLYKKIGKSIHADAILLVVYLANDLFDNQFPYPLQADHAKPYFRLNEENNLVLENTPVPQLSKPAAARQTDLSTIVLGDAATIPLLTRTLGRLHLARRVGLFQTRASVPDNIFEQRFHTAIELFLTLLHALKDSCNEQGAELTIALLPGASFVNRPDGVSARYQNYLRRTLVKALGQVSDIAVIDLADAMRNGTYGIEKMLYFPNEGHLTPEGHRYVASRLSQHLQIKGH